MAKSNFIVRGGGDFSGLYKEFNKAQKKITVFQTGVSKTLKRIGFALGSLAVGKLIKDSTKMAMGVESAMDNISRNMGKSSHAFNNWVETQSKGFGMAKADAYKYGSTFSNLLGSFTSGAKETADQTQELMKAAAIISSKTGRTYDDTANRIRSGMLGSTEAIEDLGIYTQVSMLESTDAFKKFANGKSWAQLDFQVQQQIRLAAILEQTYARYGDTLADTTQTRQAQFIASLKNIQLLLGQVFLPIWNAVLPALTAMANAIERVVSVLAAFTQALFGKATKVQTKATQDQAGAVSDLGDATEKAGKQAKGAVAGFDEINQLNLGGEGGSGIVGAVSSGMAETEQIDDGTGGALENVSTKATQMAEKVKSAFGKMKSSIVENKNIILPALGAIAGAIGGLAVYTTVTGAIGFFSNLGGAAKGAWGIIAAHPVGALVVALGALVGGLVTAYNTSDTFKGKVDNLFNTIKTNLTPTLEKLGEALKWNWENIMKPMGKFISGSFTLAFEGLGIICEWLLKNVIVPLGKAFIWLNKEVIKPLSDIMRGVFKIGFETIGDVAKSLHENILKPLGDFLKETFVESVRASLNIMNFWWETVLQPLGNYIAETFKPIIEDMIAVFEFLWKKVFEPLAKYMSGEFKTVFENVTKTFGERIELLKEGFKGLIKFIEGVFTLDWRKAWDGIKDIFNSIVGSLEVTFKYTINGIIGIANKFINFWNSIKLKVPEVDIPLVGKVGGFTVRVPKVPNIPLLAKGGIVDSPMLAMIGEQGKEAVMPLENNTGWIDDLSGKIASGIMGAMQFGPGGKDTEVVLNIDGKTFARAVIPSMNEESKRLGYKLVLRTN